MLQPTEMVMIKFQVSPTESVPSEKISIENLMRLESDLDELKNCRFVTDTEKTPLKDVQIYIQQNFQKNLSVTALAAENNYSTAQFINIFKKYYGYTPKQYVLHLRINKAKSLLTTTNKTSQEIALLCGFYDAFYFMKLFKTHTGMTPMQFRRQAKTFLP